MLTREQEQHYREHGWIFADNLVPAEDIDAAYPGLYEIYPTPDRFHSGDAEFRPGAFLAARDTNENAGTEPRFRPMQFAGLREFPFDNQSLNLLALHENLLTAVSQLLDTEDIRLYQAETFAKYTGAATYNQPYHVDYTNHLMLPPGTEGRYRQVSIFLYLSDVAAGHGPPRVVSRTLSDKYPLTELNDMGTRLNSSVVELWEANSTLATGPRGSAFIYAADVLHRATEMTLRGGARFTFNLGYKAANADWIGANPWPRKGFYAPWQSLVHGCSQRQLIAIGFPPPGHNYWSENTLKGCAERYPQLDLKPWYEAIP